MRIALIKNGRVANIVEAEQAWLDAAAIVQGESLLDVSADTTGISIGWHYDGVLFTEPTKPLAIAQSEQTAIIEAAYQSANQAQIQYNGYTFQADADSVALMAQVATALPSGASITWYDSTNTDRTMTDVQFAELRGSILMRGQPLFAKKQTLKALIRQATTVAQVEAVTW